VSEINKIICAGIIYDMPGCIYYIYTGLYISVIKTGGNAIPRFLLLGSGCMSLTILV
jgi:hypothetical protein